MPFQLNRYEANLHSMLSYLSSKHKPLISVNKAKNFHYICNLFSTVSLSLKPPSARKIPQNKHFISLSVSAIVKFVSRLLEDSLRKMRAEKEGVFIEP